MTRKMDEMTRDAKVAVFKPKPRNPEPVALPPADYILSDKGKITPILANVVTLFRSSPEWAGVLAFDEFSGRHTLLAKPPIDNAKGLFKPRAITDRDIRATVEWVQRHGISANSQTVAEAMLRACDAASFHPVREYLGGLTWDGVSRVDSFLISHAGAYDTPLTRAMTSRWMVQAVARIYNPGCQADATLILEGDQGVGKSSMLKAIFGEWHTDTLPELGSKDAMLQLRGSWCIEIAELATLGRADANRIKAFLTTREDKFRLPYGKIAETVARSNVFAGSVNPGNAGYLKDPTGARRFWPVQVNGFIDLDAISAIRDQLWAEARYRFEMGEIWYLKDADLIAAAAEVQADRLQVDAWADKIAEWLDGRDWVKVSDVLGDCIGLDLSKRGQVEQNRVTAILTHLKWTRKQRRKSGNQGREWGYVPPE